MTTIFVAGILSDLGTGYTVHASNFLRALRRISPLPVQEVDMVPSLAMVGPPPLRATADDIVIFIGSAEAAMVLEGSPAYRICYTVWESDFLPDSWQQPLSMVEEIWTASQWGARIMQQNGVDSKKVHVIQEGVSGDLFKPDGKRLSFIESISGFKFLHVGKAEPRKGTFELLQAFERAFDDDEPVYLVLSCHNQFIPNFDIVRFVENMCLRRSKWIVPIQPLPKREHIAMLYRSCDAFLAPSKAEGWGLPALEAMASGLPTALTRYSGHTEYATEDNSLAIPFAMGPLDRHSLPCFVRNDQNYGKWAEPKIDGLARIMRRMYKEREVLRRTARSKASVIHRSWSWDAAASVAWARLEAVITSSKREFA